MQSKDMIRFILMFRYIHHNILRDTIYKYACKYISMLKHIY